MKRKNMAIIFCNNLYSSSPILSPLTLIRTNSLRFSKRLRVQAQFQSMEDQNDILRRKFMEFPYVSAIRRQLMVDLMSTVEDRLQSQLLPCTLDPEVQSFQNPNGSAEASLHIRSGEKSSPIDYVLGSWIHCKMPTGVSVNITTVAASLNSSTNAPNFMIELLQNSPKSLILFLDLPHRQDLILHPDYRTKYYQDTSLNSQRQSLLKVPEIKPYLSHSLFYRSAFSPTAMMLEINAEEEEKLDEVLRDHVSPAAKEVLEVWLDRCAKEEEVEVEEEEKLWLERRDKSFRIQSIEADLESQFPILFGEEVSSRVVHAIKQAFGVL